MALTALQVKNARPGERLGDGDGLWLFVDRNSGKSWIFRFTSPTTKKVREMGFGSLRDVTLAQARDARAAARAVIRDGKDPIEERNTKRVEARVEASRAITFKDYTEQYITAQRTPMAWSCRYSGGTLRYLVSRHTPQRSRKVSCR